MTGAAILLCWRATELLSSGISMFSGAAFCFYAFVGWDSPCVYRLYYHCVQTTTKLVTSGAWFFSFQHQSQFTHGSSLQIQQFFINSPSALPDCSEHAKRTGITARHCTGILSAGHGNFLGRPSRAETRFLYACRGSERTTLYPRTPVQQPLMFSCHHSLILSTTHKSFQSDCYSMPLWFACQQPAEHFTLYLPNTFCWIARICCL